MTVNIKNIPNAKGWSEYVLAHGKREKANLVLGDTTLGDTIIKGLEYQSGNAVHFVISFSQEDHITSATQGRAIATEFMQEFMHGFKSDEYHMDMVEHTDTEHLHYHVRIPKVNLLTQTQLKLYYHKSDLGFKKAVIDHIAHKHKLTTGEASKNTIPNATKNIEQIIQWRQKHQQKPFTLNKKKGRAQAEQNSSQYIAGGIKEGLISSLDEVKQELKTLDLTIANEGYDQGKGFHYLTIENKSGKVRLKGEIYSAGFYRHSKEDREQSLRSNRSLTTRATELRKSGADIKQTLSTERHKRLKFIDAQYAKARERAYRTQNERSLRFDKQAHRPNRTADTRADGGIKRRDDRDTHGDVRRGTKNLATHETQQSSYHQNTSQTVDISYTHWNMRSPRHGGGNVGSKRETQYTTTNTQRTKRNDSPNEEITKQIRQESLEQRSGSGERTHNLERRREQSLDNSVRKKQLKEEYDTTRRRTDPNTDTNESDTRARAERLRKQLEEDSQRARRELQEAHERNTLQQASRRWELTRILQNAYRTKREDYNAIKDATQSRNNYREVRAYTTGFFSWLREQVDRIKSHIDRGNGKLFERIKGTAIEAFILLSENNTPPNKEKKSQAKKQEILNRFKKEKSQAKRKKEQKGYSGPSMGM